MNDYEQYIEYEQDFENDMRDEVIKETTEVMPIDQPLVFDYAEEIMHWYEISPRGLSDFDPEDIWNRMQKGIYMELDSIDIDKFQNVYVGFNIKDELANMRELLYGSAGKRHRG